MAAGRRTSMKKPWWIACVALSLLVGCIAQAKALDLKATLHFVDEPQLVLHEAFTLWVKYYTEAPEGKPIREESYVGYTDETGLVRKLIHRDTYFKTNKTFAEEVAIRKTSDGFYYEILSVIWGKEYSMDKYHYRLSKKGFTTTKQMQFLGQEAIALNGEQKTTTMNISYLHEDGYLWQSDYKKAKIENNQYSEHYYVKKEGMWDNIIYTENTVSLYHEYDQETHKPLIKYKYVFSYTKDPTSGEITGKLVDWLSNMKAFFDVPEQWKKNPKEIELHVKTNLHAQDRNINILNQYIIPHSEYLIPFIYGLTVNYKED
jgi:hypothetical protein